MGIWLFREGKRRCIKCKVVFDLTSKNFPRSKGVKGDFRYNCVRCHNNNRLDIIQSKNFKCENCGIYNSNASFFDVDHVIPLQKLGLSKVRRKGNHFIYSEKIQVLCPNCHRIKTLQNREFDRIL